MASKTFNAHDALELLDALDAIVYVADLQTYELLYLNKKALELFGEGIGYKCWKVLQTDQEGPCLFCTNDKLLNEDGTPAEPHVWEFKNTINGEWWECRDRAIKWTDGRYVRMEIATNITESKRIKEQLQENFEKYHTLYHNAPLPYQSLNEQGLVIDANPAWLRALGYTREEIIGKPIRDFLHPDWQPHFDMNFPEFKKRGYITDAQFKVRHKSGKYLDISVDGCIGRTAEGDFKQTYCVFQDITARKLSEQQLQESEQKFRLLAEASHDWEYWIDPAGNYKYISPACEKMTGLSPAALMEDPQRFIDMVAPADRELVYHHFSSEDERRKPAHTIEFSITNKDGQERQLEHYCAPVYDDAGHFIGRSCSNRDITERKQVEAKTKASEERLSFALKGAKCGLWDWNIRNNEVHFDENYYRMAGYEPNEFPQTFDDWESRVHPEDIDAAKERIRCYLEGEVETFSTEFRFKKKAGDWLWILGQGEFVEWGEDGSPLRMIGLHIDIDDSKQAEFNRLELEQQLRQKFKMEAVGTMAGGMAHNFNNSLAIIIGSLEMARRKIADSETVERHLRTAATAALHSRDLIQQVLSYSRQEILEMKPIQIAPVVDETQKMLRPTIPVTIELRYAVAPDCFDLVVTANPGQIQEAIFNLCNNAVQAMEESGTLSIGLDKRELTAEDIPLHCSGEPGLYARISVRDNGSGIKPELLDRIFDLFFTTKGVEKGSGIGLATVEGIMKQHDGLAKVQSSPGEGALFELYFPVTQEFEDRLETEIVGIKGGTERILLVDDDVQLAEVSAQILTELGYQVTFETSSLKALEMVKAQPERFDLLITDQTMPELTGKDLARKIHLLNPNLPIILCTGYSNLISAADASQYGISAYRSKPLQLSELALTVRNVLDER